MATVALSAVRQVPDNTKYLLIGVVVLGGGFLWYTISSNPLGKLISRWGNFALNPVGSILDTAKFGFNTFSSNIKKCKGKSLFSQIGCNIGGGAKAGFSFFSR
jgi:hypothetical protein